MFTRSGRCSGRRHSPVVKTWAPRRWVPRVEALEDRLAPATHEWTGLGGNNLWSNSLNWTNDSPAADLSGDIDLVFHTNLVNAVNLNMQNDLVGLVVDNILFDATAGTLGPTTFANGGTSSAGYTFNGNAITLNTSGGAFGIDIAPGVADPPLGITETFNVGINLVDENAFFRSQETGARLTFNGDINAGGFAVCIVNTAGASSNPDIQGVVINGDISNGGLTKDGTGTLQLTGDNTYANTVVNGGVVLVDTNTALGAAAGVIFVNDPGRILLRNGVAVVKTTLNLNSNASGGGIGADGNTTNTFQGNVVLMAGAGGVAMGAGNGVANANTRLIIDGVISGATSNLFINGAGVVEFTQNNTYTGSTLHNGVQGFGALQIDAHSGLGAGGGGNETILFRDGAGPTGSALWLNFNGTLQDAALVGENIRFAGSGVDSLGAIRTLGNANVIIPGNITFIAGAPWVFGVDGALGSITITGVIVDDGFTRALTKVGLGTLVIGGVGANTFDGTIINAGTVLVENTSLTPLGDPADAVIVNNGGTLQVGGAPVDIPNPVQLNTGGTLAGDGTISNNVTSIGGIVSPGASTEVLTVDGDVTLDVTSVFRAEINGTTVGDDYDQLIVSGTVFLNQAVLDVTVGFVADLNDQFILINATARSGEFAGLPDGSTVVFSGQMFQIDYTATQVILTKVQNLPFEDDFTQPNGTPLDANWQVPVGDFVVQSNQAKGVTGNNVAVVKDTEFAADVSVEAQITVAPGQNAGLVARWSGPGQNNLYLGALSNVGGDLQASIWQNLGGVFTQLARISLGAGGGGLLRFDVTGSKLDLLVNGFVVLTAQDNSLTAGAVGIRGAQNACWDDFLATLLGGGPQGGSTSFTGADASPLGNAFSDQVGNYTIQNNQAQGNAGNNLSVFNYLSAADVSVSAQVNVAAGQQAGLMARWSGPGESNFYLGALSNVGGVLQASIWKNIGGVFTQLVRVGLGAGNGGLLRFTVIGNQLRLFRDGIEVASALDSDLILGRVGIRSAPGATYDDFLAATV